MFKIIELNAKCALYRHEMKELIAEKENLEKEKEELLGNIEHLITENSTLKQINRKRYIKYEDKMKFLEDREKKLQVIEQMVKNGDNWRVIKAKIGETHEN